MIRACTIVWPPQESPVADLWAGRLCVVRLAEGRSGPEFQVEEDLGHVEVPVRDGYAAACAAVDLARARCPPGIPYMTNCLQLGRMRAYARHLTELYPETRGMAAWARLDYVRDRM